MVSVLSNSSLNSSATTATSDDSTRRPRPFGRSGRVTTATTSQRRATSRNDGTANDGVPMNTTRGLSPPPSRLKSAPFSCHRGNLRHLTTREGRELSLEKLTLERRQAIDEQTLSR
jgi:hypothetical protein